MLIDFTVENFRSFREPKTFSMIASSAQELWENTIDVPSLDIRLVRSAAIFGPNASGKSNLLAALRTLGVLVKFPLQLGNFGQSMLSPFRLDDLSGDRPSRFTARFLTDNRIYKYSISVKIDSVVEESLMVEHDDGSEESVFIREKSGVKFGVEAGGAEVFSRRGVVETVSVLFAARIVEYRELEPIFRWFDQNLREPFAPNHLQIDSTAMVDQRFSATRELLFGDPEFGAWATQFLGYADLGIQSLELEEKKGRSVKPRRKPSRKVDEAPTQGEATRDYDLFLIHSGRAGAAGRFKLSDESAGTLQLLAMLAPLYEVLKAGSVLVVDELGDGIHPYLTREMVRLFHDPRTNPLGAQLIFASHDATLMSGDLFRRDQIWFTEKNRAGATDLYSLNDIKGVREDDAFEKGYLQGRYGAIPFLGAADFPSLAQEGPKHKALTT